MHRTLTFIRPRRLLGALPVVGVALLLAASPAAAWDGRVEISGSTFNSNTTDNEQVVAAGGKLHFVYNTDMGPTYRRTTMDLQPSTGEVLIKLTGAEGDAEGIAVDGDLMAIVYRDYSTERQELGIRTSTNGGQSWNAPIVVAAYTNFNNKQMGKGSVAVSGQTVVVAWTDGRNGNVNLRRSTDGGQTFGSTLRLGTTTAWSWQALLDGQVQLAASGSRVVATWYGARGGGSHPKKLMLRRSSDGGATFRAKQIVDPGDQSWEGPSVAVAGTTVLVLHATKAGKVGVLRSTNGGQSFTGKDLAGTYVTHDRTDVAIDPANPSAVRAVWFARGKVYLRRSSDGGATWAAREDTLVRFDRYSWVSPNVLVTGTRTVVVWNGTVDREEAWVVVFARTDG